MNQFTTRTRPVKIMLLIVVVNTLLLLLTSSSGASTTNTEDSRWRPVHGLGWSRRGEERGVHPKTMRGKVENLVGVEEWNNNRVHPMTTRRWVEGTPGVAERYNNGGMENPNLSRQDSTPLLQTLPPASTIIHTAAAATVGNQTTTTVGNHTIIIAPIETDPASALPPLFAITALNWERLDDLGGLTKSEVYKLLITLFPFLITLIYVPLFVLTIGVLSLPVLRVETLLRDGVQ